MRDTDFFDQIPQVEFPWREASIKTPTFFRRVRSIDAGFMVHTSAVRSLLPSERLHPLRVAPTRTVLVIAALEYSDTDVGPYNEILVGLPCTLDKSSPQFAGSLRRPPETFMLVRRLGVTTEAAMYGGNDFLATKKFLADIAFEETDEWFICHALQDGMQIMTLGVRKGGLTHAPRLRNEMLSVKNGYLLRWDFLESEQEEGVSRHDADARLDLGPHPFARELGGLDLGRILECRYKPEYQAIISPISESFRC